MIREGTTEKNLQELLPLITDRTASRCLLVVDDRSPADLLDDGDIDGVVRKAVASASTPYAPSSSSPSTRRPASS